MKQKPKRRQRGKAKSLPIEARRLAYFIRRWQRGDADGVSVANDGHLISAKQWVEKKLWKTVVDDDAVHVLAEALQRTRRGRTDNEASVLDAYEAFRQAHGGRFPLHAELMDKLCEMLPTNRVPSDRTVYLIEARHHLSMVRRGRSAKKRVI